MKKEKKGMKMKGSLSKKLEGRGGAGFCFRQKVHSKKMLFLSILLPSFVGCAFPSISTSSSKSPSGSFSLSPLTTHTRTHSLVLLHREKHSLFYFLFHTLAHTCAFALNLSRFLSNLQAEKLWQKHCVFLIYAALLILIA